MTAMRISIVVTSDARNDVNVVDKEPSDMRPAPPYAQVSERIAHLEDLATACRIEGPQAGIRRVNMAFLNAAAVRPRRQADRYKGIHGL